MALPKVKIHICQHKYLSSWLICYISSLNRQFVRVLRSKGVAEGDRMYTLCGKWRIRLAGHMRPTCVWTGGAVLIHHRESSGEEVHNGSKYIWFDHLPFYICIRLREERKYIVKTNCTNIWVLLIFFVNFGPNTFVMVMKSGPKKTPLMPSIRNNCLNKKKKKLENVPNTSLWNNTTSDTKL